jgi:soluble calcium-activated nucleotidase 1
MEGDGETDKGFKCEWMTVKDDKLYVGSFGKEYTNNDGSVKNRNNNWVKTIDADGVIEHHDWNALFESIRAKLGYSFPAYILHETGVWSTTRRKWVFLPRRMSKEPYTDVADERKGANTVVVASEDGSDVSTVTVGVAEPLKGFSSAKFVPGSNEQVLVALKTEEVAADKHLASYITVLSMDGRVLMPDTPVPGRFKFEGLEFI